MSVSPYPDEILRVVWQVGGQLVLAEPGGEEQPCELSPSLDELRALAGPSGRAVEATAKLASGEQLSVWVVPVQGFEAVAVVRGAGNGDRHLAAQLELLVNQIAHDVRNHAFTIGLQVEMALRRASQSPDLRNHLEAVLRQFESLKTYLEKLLLFGRPAVLAPLGVDPVAFIREQVQRFQFGWDQASPPVAISVEASGEPGTVHWDGRAVSAALGALLDNAARAGPSGVVVRVACRPERVDVAVIDEGRGIAPDVMAQLFVPMSIRRPGGAGLGLSIARKMAEAHGGALTLETGPGGTTACLRLPREAPTG
ncbi:MAG TPA: ATP-binding protein [Thermoanaerobaculaceae bacterium]|nr:ATP-binding protein [Thermoanaerobaculaceae bacterium]